MTNTPEDSDILPNIPGSFGVDSDPFTEEDGRGDDVDRPLPDVDPDDFPREA